MGKKKVMHFKNVRGMVNLGQIFCQNRIVIVGQREL